MKSILAIKQFMKCDLISMKTNFLIYNILLYVITIFLLILLYAKYDYCICTIFIANIILETNF